MSRGKLIVLVILIAAGAAAYFFMSKSGASESATSQAAAEQTSIEAPAAGVDAEAKGAPQVSDEPSEYWTKRCNKDDKSYCEVFQLLVIKENKQRLIEFAVGYPEAGKDAQAVIAFPLGIVLEKGIALKVDDGQSSAVPIRTCNPDGCFAVMKLAADFVDAMKKGKKITVGFLDGTGKQVNIEMSLKGFNEKLMEVAK